MKRKSEMSASFDPYTVLGPVWCQALNAGITGLGEVWVVERFSGNLMPYVVGWFNFWVKMEEFH